MRTINNVDEITEIILKDQWMMDVLKAAELLDLPDWWIGAGFIRNKVWNYLENKDPEPSRDVDLVYFDNRNTRAEIDEQYSLNMAKKYDFAEWDVCNQARMNYVNDFDPFTSTADGIAHWVETATCVAVRINNGKLDYLFCYGTDDLFNLIARPTIYFSQQPLLAEFYKRVEAKHWTEKWPNLKIKI